MHDSVLHQILSQKARKYQRKELGVFDRTFQGNGRLTFATPFPKLKLYSRPTYLMLNQKQDQTTRNLIIFRILFNMIEFWRYVLHLWKLNRCQVPIYLLKTPLILLSKWHPKIRGIHDRLHCRVHFQKNQSIIRVKIQYSIRIFVNLHLSLLHPPSCAITQPRFSKFFVKFLGKSVEFDDLLHQLHLIAWIPFF